MVGEVSQLAVPRWIQRDGRVFAALRDDSKERARSPRRPLTRPSVDLGREFLLSNKEPDPDLRGQTLMLSAGADGSVVLWAESTLTSIAKTQLPGRTRCEGTLILSDGKCLAWGDKVVHVLDLTEMKRVRSQSPDHSSESVPALVSVHPFGAESFIEVRRDTTRLQNCEQPEASVEILEQEHVLGSVLLPSGALLLWTEDGYSRWSSSDGRSSVAPWTRQSHGTWHEDSELFLHRDESGDGVLVLPGGSIVQWDGGNRELWVHDVDTGTLKHTLTGHSSGVIGALVIEGQRLLSWDRDGGMKLWQLPSFELDSQVCAHDDEFKVQVLDQERLVSWDEDELKIWSPGDLRQLAEFDLWHSFKGQRLRSKIVAWEPVDDRRLKAVFCNGTRRLIDLEAQAAGESERSTCPVEGSVVWPAGLRDRGARVAWQGEGDWSLIRTLDGGYLVVSQSEQVEILELHHGAQRVTLADATALLSQMTNEPPP